MSSNQTAGMPAGMTSGQPYQGAEYKVFRGRAPGLEPGPVQIRAR